MKKLILPVLACLLTVATYSNSNQEKVQVSIEKITLSTQVNAFFKLIQMGDFDAVKNLIDAGEDVNKKSNGLTPLMFAARYNKAKIVQLLIDKGAKLKTKSDTDKMTALEMAKRSKAMDAYKIIKDAEEK